MKPSLAKANRTLAREWHPTKNAPLTPRDVTPGSNKKVWWMCKKGHEWAATTANRSNGRGCPYCAGKKVSPDNCLGTVNPTLARQWHPIRNAPLTPKDVRAGSHKHASWTCRKGHEWKAEINSRNRGTGCPYCAGQEVDKDNCLQAVNPALARQWHPTRNAPLTPKDVMSGTARKVWWLCGKGHEWKAAVLHRNRGAGCPYCAGKKADKNNSLQTLHPKLARQWHPTKNAPLTPRHVTPGSCKKVWWLCKMGHEWDDTIAHRSYGRGCPYCSRRRVSKDNCLETVNPTLARQWHPIKNAPLTPKDVTGFSSKKVWWVCRKGHEWDAVVLSRGRLGTGCPFCSGRYATDENCLQTVNPKLARQWHPKKNTPMTPRDVKAGSHKRAWWICRKGHEWEAIVKSRTEGNGCPYCAGKKADKDTCIETVSPWLAKEWHTAKNASWMPRDVAPHSQRQVWWKCKNGHEQRERVIDRYKRGGCPECTLRARVPWLFETA